MIAEMPAPPRFAAAEARVAFQQLKTQLHRQMVDAIDAWTKGSELPRKLA